MNKKRTKLRQFCLKLNPSNSFWFRLTLNPSSASKFRAPGSYISWFVTWNSGWIGILWVWVCTLRKLARVRTQTSKRTRSDSWWPRRIRVMPLNLSAQWSHTHLEDCRCIRSNIFLHAFLMIIFRSIYIQWKPLLAYCALLNTIGFSLATTKRVF